MPHTKIKHARAVFNGATFGHFEDARWDGTRKALVGTLVNYCNPVGERVRQLLETLESKGRLHAIGLAVELDVVLANGEVQSVVRCHRVHLTTRSACGGGFRSRGKGGRQTVPNATQEPKRHRAAIADARALIGIVGPLPEGVGFLQDPPVPTKRRNADGTYRVVEYKPLAPDPGTRRRLGRIADTLADSREYGAFVAADELDRLDKVARALRGTALHERRWGQPDEKEARAYFGFGAAEETSSSLAEKRYMKKARDREKRREMEPINHEPATREDPRSLMEQRELRDVVDHLRETDLAAHAEASYLMRSSGETRRSFADANDVTVEAMRASQARLRRHLIGVA